MIGSSSSTLVVEVPGRLCALPLRQVIETMRPLSVEPVAGAPLFVKGVAIIRDIPTPVVDLGALLGTPSEVAERFVTLRVRDTQVALAVNGVLGVRDLDLGARVQPLPPLLRNASKDIVQMLGTLDEELLMVLRDGWELPEGVWQAVLAEERVL